MAVPFLPHLRAAVRQAAEVLQSAWQAMVQGTGGSPAYRARTLAVLSATEQIEHPFHGDPFQASIPAPSPMAQGLESGSPAYHLPSRVRWGLVRRRNKHGRPYLLIPFQHLAPRSGQMRAAMTPAAQYRMMPWRVYQRARHLRPGQYLTSGHGGGAGVSMPGLTPYVPRYAPNVRPGYTHAPREERMRRVPGPGRSGTYLTFRTMTPDSPGWWIPARPKRPQTHRVRQESTEEVREILGAALQEDVTQMLREQLP